MPRKRNWVWSGKSWLFTERGLGFQTRISKRDPNSGPSGLESSAFFKPLWLHRPTEQSHCGSVVLVVAELRHCFGIRINMNAKNSRAKPMTLCNTVFMLVLLAALSTCHGNAFGAWSGKQRQRKKAGYLQIVARTWVQRRTRGPARSFAWRESTKKPFLLRANVSYWPWRVWGSKR